MATLQQVTIAGLIFVTVFSGLIITFGDFVNTYDLTQDDFYFSSEYENGSDIEQVYNLSKEMQSTFEEHKTDEDNLDTSIVGGLKAIKKIPTVFELTKKSINFIAVTIGIPRWLTNAILGGLLITFFLAVIAAYLGRRTD